MKFRTCDCPIDTTRCILTGFRFTHEGVGRVGDLFLCEKHKTLTIHGINDGTLEFKDTNSSYTGAITCQDERYGETEAYGIINLVQRDIDYINRHRDISDYAIKQGPPTNELETTINDEAVTVEYTYDLGYPGSYYQPDEPASVEIERVLYKGLDIQDMLSEAQLETLAEECLHDMSEAAQSAAESAADAEYERQKEERNGF